MARKAAIPEELPRPKLLKPREEVRGMLNEQIRKGQELAKLDIASEQALEQAEADEKKWADYNEELLGVVFSNSKFSDEFRNNRWRSVMSMGSQGLWQEVADFQEDMARQITTLESINERINLIEEDTVNPTNHVNSQPPVVAKKTAVFVVHGRDEKLTNSVTTLLSKLKIRPIILADESSEGRTLIEKFEDYADEASFAVVLLTPDDLGRIAGVSKDGSEPGLEPRARQNVVLEFGYFMGKLGRQNVCALLAEKVVNPSDIAGFVYVPVDDGNAWQYKLAKELRAAGYKADSNDI